MQNSYEELKLEILHTSKPQEILEMSLKPAEMSRPGAVEQTEVSRPGAEMAASLYAAGRSS